MSTFELKLIYFRCSSRSFSRFFSLRFQHMIIFMFLKERSVLLVWSSHLILIRRNSLKYAVMKATKEQAYERKNISLCGLLGEFKKWWPIESLTVELCYLKFKYCALKEGEQKKKKNFPQAFFRRTLSSQITRFWWIGEMFWRGKEFQPWDEIKARQKWNIAISKSEKCMPSFYRFHFYYLFLNYISKFLLLVNLLRLLLFSPRICALLLARWYYGSGRKASEVTHTLCKRRFIILGE